MCSLSCVLALWHFLALFIVISFCLCKGTGQERLTEVPVPLKVLISLFLFPFPFFLFPFRVFRIVFNLSVALFGTVPLVISCFGSRLAFHIGTFYGVSTWHSLALSSWHSCFSLLLGTFFVTILCVLYIGTLPAQYPQTLNTPFINVLALALSLPTLSSRTSLLTYWHLALPPTTLSLGRVLTEILKCFFETYFWS